ncbi:putative MhmaT1 transposase [Trichonephila clavipes]|nr:putative MhmaT1 transposase [Trichonephila clavipes]
MTTDELVLFTDEKVFDAEESFNHQNVHGIFKKLEKKKACRELIIIIWWSVIYEGISEIQFGNKGVKTTTTVYQNIIIEPIVNSLNVDLFNGNDWTLQLGVFPAYKVKTYHRGLKGNVSDLIKHENWPSSRPDLNPLDNKLWSVLKAKLCSSKQHPN